MYVLLCVSHRVVAGNQNERFLEGI